MMKGIASQIGCTGLGLEVGRQAKSTGSYRELDVTRHRVYSHTESGRRLQMQDNQISKDLELGIWETILYNAQPSKEHT